MSNPRNIQVLKQELAVTAGAYTADDVFGAKATLQSPDLGKVFSGIIHSIEIVDKGAKGKAFHVILFDSDPENSTFTDNGTLAVHADDKHKIAHVVAVPNLKTYAGQFSIAQAKGLMLDFRSYGAPYIWAVVITDDTTAPGAVDDYQLRIGIEPIQF